MLLCYVQGLQSFTGFEWLTGLKRDLGAGGLGFIGPALYTTGGLGFGLHRVYGFSLGCSPYTNSPQIGIIVGGSIIPIQDCEYKGEHPTGAEGELHLHRVSLGRGE